MCSKKQFRQKFLHAENKENVRKKRSQTTIKSGIRQKSYDKGIAQDRLFTPKEVLVVADSASDDDERQQTQKIFAGKSVSSLAQSAGGQADSEKRLES